MLRLLVVRHRLGVSQLGEDKILRKIFSRLKIRDVVYLDIGTNDPIYNNNTFFFYMRGNRGVCVEANPKLAAAIRRVRPGDICLNVGACGQETAGTKAFFVSTSGVLSSFSEEHVKTAKKAYETIEIPVMPIRDIIDQHCSRPPDLISLDVEGMEEDILSGIDFASVAPAVFCIETLTISGQKRPDLFEFMAGRGYVPVADTYVNTIFVRGDLWTGSVLSLHPGSHSH